MHKFASLHLSERCFRPSVHCLLAFAATLNAELLRFCLSALSLSTMAWRRRTISWANEQNSRTIECKISHGSNFEGLKRSAEEDRKLKVWSGYREEPQAGSLSTTVRFSSVLSRRPNRCGANAAKADLKTRRRALRRNSRVSHVHFVCSFQW